MADAAGQIIRLDRCGSGSSLYRDARAFAGEFRAALDRTLAAGLHRSDIRLAGLAGPMDQALVAEVLEGELPEITRATYSEGDIARGIYGIAAGVALVAGTGCSCSAVDEAGRLTSFGGFGPQFGDEGSAYWIGCEALKSAFLAGEGRIAPTALLDAARAFYGVDSPWGIHAEAEGTGHVPAPRIAAFAVAVDAAAGGGDPCAGRILDAAGAHLGRLILDTAARARLSSDPVPLVMAGGTLRSARVVSAIERTLAAGPIAFAHHPIVHEPIDGLIRLLLGHNAMRTANHVP